MDEIEGTLCDMFPEYKSNFKHRQIETIFHPEKNLKSGNPGRPQKIRIILRKHIHMLSNNNFNRYDTDKMSDPLILCFYKILSLCTDKNILYKCWPSMMSIASVYKNIDVCVTDKFEVLHNFMFKKKKLK